jgi:hypothetical protein
MTFDPLGVVYLIPKLPRREREGEPGCWAGMECLGLETGCAREEDRLMGGMPNTHRSNRFVGLGHVDYSAARRL